MALKRLADHTPDLAAGDALPAELESEVLLKPSQNFFFGEALRSRFSRCLRSPRRPYHSAREERDAQVAAQGYALLPLSADSALAAGARELFAVQNAADLHTGRDVPWRGGRRTAPFPFRCRPRPPRR